MKNILFIVFTLFAVVPLMAQDPNITQKAEPKEEEPECRIYGKIINLKAEPARGMVEFRNDFLRKFKVPDNMPSHIKEVTIEMRFTVEKDGSVTGIRVMNDKYNLGDEAIRVLKTMPKWKPAKHLREPIQSRFAWSVNVKIN